MNLLETCLLMTNYRNLHLTPHSFRLGAASNDRLQGVNLREIEDRGRWGPKSKAIEAYTRQDLVVLDPDTLWEQRPVYRKYWPHQRLVFISKSVVEKSFQDKHPFRSMLEEWYPEIITAYDSDIPTVFPDQDAQDRMREIRENKTSGKFLKKFAAEEVKLQKDCAHRSETATALRRSAQRRIKGAKLPWSYLRNARVKVGVNDNKQSQTEPKKVSTASTQTDGVIILTNKEFAKISKSQIVPVVDAEQLPQRLPLTDKLRHITANVPTFRVKSLGADMALTKQQIKERMKADPLLQVSRISMSAKQRYQLRCSIRRRISKRYRDHKNNSRYRYVERKKGVPQRKPTKDLEKTGTINRLVEFFFAEVLQHGKEGMPTWIEEQDPPYSDEEYEDRVKHLYRNKPPQYEQLLKIKLHSTNRKKRRYRQVQTTALIPSPCLAQSTETDNNSSDEEPIQWCTQRRKTRSISSLMQQFNLKEAQVKVTPIVLKQQLQNWAISPVSIEADQQPPVATPTKKWEFQVKNTPTMSPDLFSLESEPVVPETPPSPEFQCGLVRKVSRKIKHKFVRLPVPETTPSYEKVLAEHNLQLVDSLFESPKKRKHRGVTLKRIGDFSNFSFPLKTINLVNLIFSIVNMLETF